MNPLSTVKTYNVHIVLNFILIQDTMAATTDNINLPVIFWIQFTKEY